jgi:hypothetical protein
MGLRRCDKCSEMVDEAKAFCPACGNAFVSEEKRQKPSGYDSLDNTLQMGNTMYGQMLSDMGLNIAKGAQAQQPQAKKVETITPIAAARPTERTQQVARAAAEAAATVPRKKSYLTWTIVGAGLLFAALVLLIAIAFFFYVYLQR